MNRAVSLIQFFDISRTTAGVTMPITSACGVAQTF